MRNRKKNNWANDVVTNPEQTQLRKYYAEKDENDSNQGFIEFIHSSWANLRQETFRPEKKKKRREKDPT